MQRSRKDKPQWGGKQLETDSEVAQMIELREKNVKIVMINILHMFKHVHGSMNSFRRDRDDIKKTIKNFWRWRIQCLRWKIHWMRLIVGRILQKRKISELEYSMAIIPLKHNRISALEQCQVA